MMNNALATMLLNESDEALKKRKHTHTYRHKNPKNGSTDLYIYGYTVGLCHHTAHSTKRTATVRKSKLNFLFGCWNIDYIHN